MLFGLNIVFWLLFWTEYYVLALCICCLQQSQWPRGVTVSTLDSESSDRGSNPREAFTVPTAMPSGEERQGGTGKDRHGGQ